MSLRGFHILFIVASIVLSIGFSAWAFRFYGTTQNVGYFMTGFCAAISTLLLGFYLNSFVHKVKG